MSNIKKICLYTCIILLILSLYNDFQKGSPNRIHPTKHLVEDNISVVKIKVNAGDTVLSVSERINGETLKQIQIENIIKDFTTVNPEITSLELTPDMYYFFPVYSQEKGAE